MKAPAIASALCATALFAIASPIAAQDSSEAAPPDQDDGIVVEGEIVEDSGESISQRVRRIGRQITRPARGGRPIARFDAPICLKISGMPDDVAKIVRDRIEENAAALGRVNFNEDSDCSINAFIGFSNNVTSSVEQLEKDEPWLFDGLLSFQVDRIYKGSDAVRSWHVFSRRNLDGTDLPADTNRGNSLNNSQSGRFNRVEFATRLVKERSDLRGAVVLIEINALRDKTLRQIADYATFRLLASVSDDVKADPNTPETILTLFNDVISPRAITPFDMAYLEALYDLPPNSRDGTVITAAVRRYEKRVEAEAEGDPSG